jgi:HEAT repeat protein
MKKLIISIGCLLILSATISAQEIQPDYEKQVAAIIECMKSATGEEYEKARAEGVALVPQVKTYLEQKATTEKWTGESWQDALFAALLLGWAENAKAFLGCYNLDGIKPENYTKWALAKPNVQRELQKLGQSAVPALIEIFLKTLDSYPLGTPEPGTGADAQTLDAAVKARKAERNALRTGIVAALGRIADSRAFRFFSELLEKSTDKEIRVLAADGAALCGGEEAVPVLTKLLSDKNTAESVREACAHALGYSKGQAALSALKTTLSDTSATVRSSAAKGLARMGSLLRWKLKNSLENAEIQTLRKAAAAALAGRLASESDTNVRREIVQALGRIADASVLEALREIAEETSDKGIKAAAQDAIERISRKAPPGISER